MCLYLGYKDYKGYLLSLNENRIVSEEVVINHKNPKKLSESKKTKLLIIISIVVIISLFITNSITKQRWMIWNGSQYEEVDFNKADLGNGDLKAYKKERIESFKKATNLDCHYDYFNIDGSVRIWYGKNKKGELDFFTDLGLHPETGKTLKPITVYMIRKYICKTY